MKEQRPEIEKLTSLMERLRGPDGCPWDREQTLKSLVPFIIEEAYEVVAAIDNNDPEELKDELGDLLFQVVFACEISRASDGFDLNAVIENSVEKMVRRHPHVFGDESAETASEVLDKWDQIKKTEKAEKKGRTTGHGLLSGIPDKLPALMRAQKVSKKASKAGFDWTDAKHVLDKLDEEVVEFKEAVLASDPEAVEGELGDILFTLVNVARFVEVNPEDALRKTIGKFINRFHHVERELERSGQDLATTRLEEMERLWEEAKKRESE